MAGLEIEVLPLRLSVVRLDGHAQVPRWALDGELFSVTRTARELSVVAPTELVPSEVERAEHGWQALAVAGPLAFSLTGVLDSVAAPLARAGISLFAVSTYDTDYVLVKVETVEAAVRALRAAGHRLHGVTVGD
jgi:hypothetical protein